MALKQQSRMMCARMYSNMAVICHVKKVGYKITIVLCFQYIFKNPNVHGNQCKETDQCLYFLYLSKFLQLYYLYDWDEKKSKLLLQRNKNIFPPICISFILY